MRRVEGRAQGRAPLCCALAAALWRLVGAVDGGVGGCGSERTPRTVLCSACSPPPSCAFPLLCPLCLFVALVSDSLSCWICFGPSGLRFSGCCCFPLLLATRHNTTTQHTQQICRANTTRIRRDSMNRTTIVSTTRAGRTAEADGPQRGAVLDRARIRTIRPFFRHSCRFCSILLRLCCLTLMPMCSVR